ncbi:unnamed protein product [Heligmosomoides polygyrus]|uniref:Uncharacterized protein n=1 Tax=Heligmosomoides polygyrus TaxID=6339 RepID=A0A183FIW6_HELPZ|nr:unnamed protein product [Heligmosomoides polygyrus]
MAHPLGKLCTHSPPEPRRAEEEGKGNCPSNSGNPEIAVSLQRLIGISEEASAETAFFSGHGAARDLTAPARSLPAAVAASAGRRRRPTGFPQQLARKPDQPPAHSCPLLADFRRELISSSSIACFAFRPRIDFSFGTAHQKSLPYFSVPRSFLYPIGF